MKLVRRSSRSCVFLLSPGEQEVLRHLLGQFPLVDPGFVAVSRCFDAAELGIDPELLQDSFREEKSRLRQQLDAFLADRSRFRKGRRGWLLKLTPEEVDWMLQILGDIRVGCWRRLGQPDPARRLPDGLAPERIAFHLMMDRAERCQWLLIQAARRF